MVFQLTVSKSQSKDLVRFNKIHSLWPCHSILFASRFSSLTVNNHKFRWNCSKSNDMETMSERLIPVLFNDEDDDEDCIRHFVTVFFYRRFLSIISNIELKPTYKIYQNTSKHRHTQILRRLYLPQMSNRAKTKMTTMRKTNRTVENIQPTNQLVWCFFFHSLHIHSARFVYERAHFEFNRFFANHFSINCYDWKPCRNGNYNAILKRINCFIRKKRVQMKNKCSQLRWTNGIHTPGKRAIERDTKCRTFWNCRYVFKTHFVCEFVEDTWYDWLKYMEKRRI